MANTVLLEQKAEQLQAELSQWALENDVLEAGEEIILSLRVDKMTTVVRRDPQDFEGEIQRLEITKDHIKLGYKWIAPARLNDNEVEQVLSQLSGKARRNAERLLRGGNIPLKIIEQTDGNFYNTFQRMFRDLVLNGKKYRLARNRLLGSGGHYYVQLWEIEGSMKSTFALPTHERTAGS